MTDQLHSYEPGHPNDNVDNRDYIYDEGNPEGDEEEPYYDELYFSQISQLKSCMSRDQLNHVHEEWLVKKDLKATDKEISDWFAKLVDQCAPKPIDQKKCPQKVSLYQWDPERLPLRRWRDSSGLPARSYTSGSYETSERVDGDPGAYDTSLPPDAYHDYLCRMCKSNQ